MSYGADIWEAYFELDGSETLPSITITNKSADLKREGDNMNKNTAQQEAKKTRNAFSMARDLNNAERAEIAEIKLEAQKKILAVKAKARKRWESEQKESKSVQILKARLERKKKELEALENQIKVTEVF